MLSDELALYVMQWVRRSRLGWTRFVRFLHRAQAHLNSSVCLRFPSQLELRRELTHCSLALIDYRRTMVVDPQAQQEVCASVRARDPPACLFSRTHHVFGTLITLHSQRNLVHASILLVCLSPCVSACV